MSDPIVITACGAICALGTAPDQIHEALCLGRTAFKPLLQCSADGAEFPLIASIEALQPGAIFDDRKLLKSVQRLRRTDLLGLYAASRAVRSSGIIGYCAGLDGARALEISEGTAVFTGCGGVAYHYQYDFMPALAGAGDDVAAFGKKAAESVNPTWLLQALPNNVLCYLGIAYGFKGANACFTNQGVSGTLAITEAFEALRAGQAQRALAVGHDCPVEPEMIQNAYHLGLLATDAMRPFDAARSGFLLGEGAAAMMLETQAAAHARGAPALGAVLGAGVTVEAGGVMGMRSDGDGGARAIELALEQAGIGPREVGLIAAHGGATIAADASEGAAIRRVFGAGMPPVTSFKWAFGHTMAAAGALDAVIALTCLRAVTVPGIGTLSDPDPRCLPLAISASQTTPRGDIALVLGRGFGGMNTALVIKAPLLT